MEILHVPPDAVADVLPLVEADVQGVLVVVQHRRV